MIDLFCFLKGRLDLCMTSADSKGDDLLVDVDSVNTLNVTFHLHKAEIKVNKNLSSCQFLETGFLFFVNRCTIAGSRLTRWEFLSLA